MLIDLSLIKEAEYLCEGNKVHKLKKAIAAYQMSYQHYLDFPRDEYLKMVEKSEKSLFKLVDKERKKKFKQN
jgi:hypothetical protein